MIEENCLRKGIGRVVEDTGLREESQKGKKLIRMLLIHPVADQQIDRLDLSSQNLNQ